MYPSQERVSDVSADLWRHVYRSQRELEGQGQHGLLAVLPALFAMYHCAAEAVMGLSQAELETLNREFEDNVENLAQDELIDRTQAAEMLAQAGRTRQDISWQMVRERAGENPNPIRALVRGTVESLGLGPGEYDVALASQLTEFLVLGTVRRKDGAHGAHHSHGAGGAGT